MKISLMLVVFATFIYELFMISLICVYIYDYMYNIQFIYKELFGRVFDPFV